MSPPAKPAFQEPRIKGPVDCLLILFGDQLSLDAAVLRELDRTRDGVLLMEVAEEATHLPSHRQRTTLFLAAMRHFANELVRRGYRLQYVTLDDPANTHNFSDEVCRAVDALTPNRLILTRPGEWRVLSAAQRWQTDIGIPVEIREDDHFLLTPAEFADWAQDRKRIVLEDFYRTMRRRLDVLLDNRGQPLGGQWNFDKQNRNAFPGGEIPQPPTFHTSAITREVLTLVTQRFPNAPGNTQRFNWPVSRAQAKRALKHFIRDRLPNFGRYQDAMQRNKPWMFHALLSSSLNLHLLRPMEVVHAAIDAYKTGAAPLNSVEGFVRQIIGWREFIRGIYWYTGEDYATRNSLNESGSLPSCYWSAETEMACMHACISQVLDHGYGHHIQRLMVTGNFALIAGVHPREVCDWYLGMYVDAVDWVTLPNTLGMVMHADGGLVATKPYAASGQYIRRMSDYCNSCRFDPAKRTGPDACPLTTFYWDFLLRHEQRFRQNRRMKLMMSHLDRMSKQEHTAIRRHAELLRRQFEIAPPKTENP